MNVQSCNLYSFKQPAIRINYFNERTLLEQKIGVKEKVIPWYNTRKIQQRRLSK